MQVILIDNDFTLIYGVGVLCFPADTQTGQSGAIGPG